MSFQRQARVLLAGSVVLLVVGIYFGIQHERRAAISFNEGSAYVRLSQLEYALDLYYDRYGHYPDRAEQLRAPAGDTAPDENHAATLSDPTSANPVNEGYAFTYHRTKDPDGYRINADPVSPGHTGVRHWYTSSDGPTRFDDQKSANGNSTIAMPSNLARK